MRNGVVLILALVGGSVELACTGTVSGALIADDAGVGGVVVSVSPQASSVLPQGTATFTAEATGFRPHMNKRGQAYGSYDE